MSESTSLAILTPRSLDECSSIAKQLAASSLLPAALRNKVPEVMMTIMAGAELGIPPITALRSIYVIEGRTVLSADLMVAAAMRSPACLYFRQVEASDTSVTWETHRKGDDKPATCTWTIQQAKNAGLYPTKSNWQCFPRQMLSARAKSELARNVYADVLSGCYSKEEHEDMSPISVTQSADAIDVEFSESITHRMRDVVARGDAVAALMQQQSESPTAAVRDALIADINAAMSGEQLDALLPRFADLPKSGPPSTIADRKTAHAAWTARKAAVPATLEAVTESAAVEPSPEVTA